jgi:hypothetical protein
VDKRLSPGEQARELQRQIGALLSRFDIDAEPAGPREQLTWLKRAAADLRLDVRDFFGAQTRAEQERLGNEAVDRLKQLEKLIAKLSEQGYVGAADVAQLSAHSQQLMAALQE